ncbi:unnamed protein product, partial [Meganyctiphanes norvegica]
MQILISESHLNISGNGPECMSILLKYIYIQYIQIYIRKCKKDIEKIMPVATVFVNYLSIHFQQFCKAKKNLPSLRMWYTKYTIITMFYGGPNGWRSESLYIQNSKSFVYKLHGEII